MIVCRDDHERHLFHSSDIHSLMERAGLHSAFADASQPDEVFLAFKSLGHQCADRDGHHRAEMTNHCEFVLARMAAVNIAVASPHRAQARAEICARDVEKWL